MYIFIYIYIYNIGSSWGPDCGGAAASDGGAGPAATASRTSRSQAPEPGGKRTGSLGWTSEQRRLLLLLVVHCCLCCFSLSALQLGISMGPRRGEEVFGLKAPIARHRARETAVC